MAKSGQIQAALSKDLYIRLAWVRTSQDTSNNTSTVDVTLSVGASFYVSSSATKSASITVNGSTTTHSFVIGTYSGAWNKVIATRSVVIPHDSDGSKTFALSAWADVQISYGGKYVGRGSVSGSGTLDSIPRASSFSSLPSSTAMGSTWSATIAMASPSFSHAVDLIFGGVTHNIYNLLTPSVSYGIPLSWAARIPKATSGTMTIVLKTYSGTTLVGTKSYTATLTVPSSVVPSFSSLAITRVDGPVPSAWGVYVQGKSKVTASIQSPQGAQGSTITGYSIKLDSSTATTQSKTFDLTTSGTKTITATVKDSRGRTAKRTATITVQPYSAPTLSNVAVERCLSDGTPDTDGTYLRAKIDYTLSSVAGKNTTATQTKITYRKKGTTTWSTGPTFADNVYTPVFGAGLVSTDVQYEVGIVVSDPISSSNYATTVGTALVTMDFRKGGRGVAVGMVAGKDNFFESDFVIDAYKGARLYKGGSIVLDTTSTHVDLNGLGNAVRLYGDSNKSSIIVSSAISINSGTSDTIVTAGNIRLNGIAYLSDAISTSAWEVAEPLFLDSNHRIYRWTNAPRRPTVVNGSVPTGTVIAGGGLYAGSVSHSMGGIPRSAIADMSNRPGGSAYLTVRVHGISATKVDYTIYNAGAAQTTLSGALSIRVTLIW